MDAIDELKSWLDANPAASGWERNDLPDELAGSVRSAYYNDPVGFTAAVVDQDGWSLMDLRDNPEDTHGWLVTLKTDQGELSIYSNRAVFAEMAKCISAFNKANKTWYGRLWLRFIFWLNAITKRNKK